MTSTLKIFNKMYHFKMNEFPVLIFQRCCFFSPYFNHTLNFTKYNRLKMLPFTIVFILLKVFFFASFYSLDKSLYNSVVRMVISLKIQLATLTCAHWAVSLIFYVFF